MTPWAASRYSQVGVAGFEPAISCARRTRQFQAFLHAATKEHPAGVEPALSAWQADRLPLHHGCGVLLTKLSMSKEHRVGLEPTSPRYGCGILAARRPVLVLVGQAFQPDGPYASISISQAGKPDLRISGTRRTRTVTDLGKSQARCR